MTVEDRPGACPERPRRWRIGVRRPAGAAPPTKPDPIDRAWAANGTIQRCQACGSPTADILCEECKDHIDEDTDLLLEQRMFDELAAWEWEAER